MEPLTHKDIKTLNKVIGDLYSIHDLDVFHVQTLGLLKRIVPTEFASYNEYDSSNFTIIRFSNSVPEHDRLFNANKDAFHAHIHEHPYFSVTPGDLCVALSDLMEKERFKGLTIYNEYYRHLQIDSQIAVTIPSASAGDKKLFCLSRWRRDFTERDRAMLTLLRPHIINALRIVRELGLYRNEALLLEKVVETDGRGVVVFGPDGRIEHLTPFASELLSRHTGVIHRAGDLLPEVVLVWIQREIASPVLYPERRSLSIENGGNRFQARLVRDVEARGYMLLLTEDKVESPLSYRSLGLTERESETLHYVAKGKTNLDIAYILRVGERTIEKHLENVYKKLGVETRTAAVAMVMQK